MPLFARTYPAGQFRPERGVSHDWQVLCVAGALEVLARQEYSSKLAGDSSLTYSINFCNGAVAEIKPGDPLWHALAGIAQEYDVQVFRAPPFRGFVPWAGSTDDLTSFDCIRIRMREGHQQPQAA